MLVVALCVALVATACAAAGGKAEESPAASAGASGAGELTYAIVDTDQSGTYGNTVAINAPEQGEPIFGQDGQIDGIQPNYADNGDGTVTNNVTGLTWQESPDKDGGGDIDAADKLSLAQAQAYPAHLNAAGFAGYSDRRLQTIKELHSLILFSGVDPSGYEGSDTSGLVPFIDSDHFDFAYGDTAAGERIIDAQNASSTLYVSDEDGELLFGVNFADGRIKGYGTTLMGRDKTFLSSACAETRTVA